MKKDVKNASIHLVIPSRVGSKRIKLKNLRNLNGTPLIELAIKTAKESKITNDIYINSDSELFETIAKKNNVNFYKRPIEMGKSESLMDEYVYDYITNKNPDYLLILNPTSPFFKKEGLIRAWNQFCSSDSDTQLSCEKIQTHCFFNKAPINFSINSKHPRSQDLEPIRALNFAVTILNTKKFVENYKNNNYGLYSGKIDFFETESWESIDIDYEDDFKLAEQIDLFLKNTNKKNPSYPDFVKNFLKDNPDPSN